MTAAYLDRMGKDVMPITDPGDDARLSLPWVCPRRTFSFGVVFKIRGPGAEYPA